MNGIERGSTSRACAAAGAMAVGAAMLLLVAALPAVAQTYPAYPAQMPAQVSGGTQGASLVFRSGLGTLVTRFAPVIRFGNAQASAAWMRPRFAVAVGHFAVAMPPSHQLQLSDIVTFTSPVLMWGQGGYSVPRYDYRADRTPPRGLVALNGDKHGHAYRRPAYDYSPARYASAHRRYQNAARRRAEWEALQASQLREPYFGTFNAPANPPAPRRAATAGAFNAPTGYVHVGLTQTPRPGFTPLVRRIAGAPAKSGPMPLLHWPVGKPFFRIE